MATKRFDVVTIGGATVDVFIDTEYSSVFIDSRSLKEKLMAYPIGAKIKIDRINFSTGGGGTNCASGFSKMGLRTGFLGCIGNDDNGKAIINSLRNDKVAFLGNITKRPSGYSVILDSIKHDRTILTFRGSNEFLDISKKGFEKINSKWFHFSALTGKSLDTLKKIAGLCKKSKIPYSFNIATYLAKEGFETTKEIIEGCDVFILNKEEASLILGEEGTEIQMLRKLISKGAKSCIITDGPKGIYAIDKELNYHRLKAHRVKVVESTGAGDSFCTGFVTGLIKEQDFLTSLKIGLANSEANIQIKGAKEGLLDYKNALKAIKKEYY